jgi:hypothetical protein
MLIFALAPKVAVRWVLPLCISTIGTLWLSFIGTPWPSPIGTHSMTEPYQYYWYSMTEPYWYSLTEPYRSCLWRCFDNNNSSKHAYAGQLNSFTHLRALMVLHGRDILVPSQNAFCGRHSRRWAKRVAYVWCVVSAAQLGVYSCTLLYFCLKRIPERMFDPR